MVGLEKFSELAAIIKQNDNIILFAILKMDDLTDRWSLLFSAPDVDDETARKKYYDFVLKALHKNFNEDDMQDVARIGMFTPQSHLVSDALKLDEGKHIMDYKLNGSFVHDGYILISRKEPSNLKLKV